MGSFIIPLIVIMITYYHIYQAAKNRIQRRRDSLPKVRASERIRINNIRNSAIASCTDINRKADGETSRKVKRDVESSVRRPSTSELQRKKKVEPTASFSKGIKDFARFLLLLVIIDFFVKFIIRKKIYKDKTQFRMNRHLRTMA